MIRQAQEKDIEGIIRLLEQVLEVHHKGRPDLFKGNATKYTRDELKEILKDPDRPVFVSEGEEGEVQGYAFCVVQMHPDDNILTDIKTLYIDDLCVDEAQRGTGIGKALYDHVLAFAKANGCYNVTLNVWAGNDSALRFYQHQGLTMQKYGMEVILQRN